MSTNVSFERWLKLRLVAMRIALVELPLLDDLKAVVRSRHRRSNLVPHRSI